MAVFVIYGLPSVPSPWVEGSITVWLVSSLTVLHLVASLHRTKNIFSCKEESNLVKQETIRTVILSLTRGVSERSLDGQIFVWIMVNRLLSHLNYFSWSKK